MKPGQKNILIYVTLCILSTGLCMLQTVHVNAQSCTSTQFAKIFGFTGNSRGGFFEKTADTGYLFGTVKDRKNTVVKVDRDAKIIWAKTYDHVNPFDFSTQCSGKVDVNGNYFIDLNAEAVALLDAAGNVITMKALKIPGFNLTIQSLQVLPDNKKLVFARDWSPNNKEAYLLTCLSADLSTVLWTKHFEGFATYIEKTYLLNGKIYITGQVNTQGLFLCLDAATGNLIYQATYTANNTFTTLNDVFKTDSGFIITGRTAFSPFRFILRLNNNFEPVNYYKYNYPGLSPNVSLIVEPDGTYYSSWTEGLTHIRLYMSAQDNVIWCRQTITSGLATPIGFYKTTDGLILFATSNLLEYGNGSHGPGHVISKSDRYGVFAGCQPVNYNFPKASIQLVKATNSFQLTDTSIINLVNLTPIVNNITYNLYNRCSGANSCSNVSVLGPATICNAGPVIFTGRKNTGCYAPVEWQVTGGLNSTVRLSDTTIAITFLEKGNFKIVATLGNTCHPITGSSTVHVASLINSFSIGPPDSVLCSGNTIRLNAGNWFTDYLWQDGSKDSLYNVILPGLYYLTATSACGQKYSDTITITGAPAVNFTVGPDRAKCNHDTLQLKAPDGFSSYSWSPDYHISSLNSAAVIINPAVDTAYYIKAEKFPGCFGIDTIQITVNHTRPANLGSDTSICSWQQLILNAGTGYRNYLWSTGETSNRITVNAAGPYWLEITDIMGCSIKESIQVFEKSCTSAVYFPNSFTPNNDGINDLFKPKLYGTLRQYQLSVFDRYGQLVFYSEDPGKGWDGKFNNKILQTASFTWVARFSLLNQLPEIQKGSILLLR